jgi:hypothetical protein
MRRASAQRISAIVPDWKGRSDLALSPGRWRMRNDHVAIITHQKLLPYKSGGKDKVFPIWVGRCENCSTPCTWNDNGTYSAVGKHQNDILVAE